MNHRRRRRLGQVVPEPGADLLDLRDLPCLVDVPQLGEPPHLALVVAPRPGERSEARRRDVGGVDLDEHVDEVVAETTARTLMLESRR